MLFDNLFLKYLYNLKVQNFIIFTIYNLYRSIHHVIEYYFYYIELLLSNCHAYFQGTPKNQELGTERLYYFVSTANKLILDLKYGK